MKNKKVEYKYEKNDKLLVTIYFKHRVSKKSTNLIYIIISFIPTIVLIIFTVIIILGLLKLLLIEHITYDNSIESMIILFGTVSITGLSLYGTLKYNFGKAILILDNKNKVLEHKLLVCGVSKVKSYNYSDICKIESKMSRGKCIGYYCSFMYKGKEYKFLDCEDWISGKHVVDRINDFISI